jgi:hypothetical protein
VSIMRRLRRLKVSSKNERYYLVRDFTEVNDPRVEEPVDSVVYGDDIIRIIDEAKEEGRKISIYTIGECLLDWS